MLGIFLDTETNGLNPQVHRILEIAYKIVDLSTGKLIDILQHIVFQSKDVWEKSDKKSLAINGFSLEQVFAGEKEEDIAKEILVSFKKHTIERKKAVFICQNPSFDRVFFSQLINTDLQEKLLLPYHWLDLASMYFAISIKKAKNNQANFPWETGLSKDCIAKALSLPSEKKPHRAMNGVNHLLLCYKNLVGFCE